MSKLFDRPTIYISHAIRGVSGDMKGNCKKAQKAVEKLRKLFPDINFYCPADNDLIIQILCNSGRLSEEDVLWADCEILAACDGWIFYAFEPSKGSELERSEALFQGFIQYLTPHSNDIMFDISKANYSKLRSVFTPIVNEATEHFRRS